MIDYATTKPGDKLKIVGQGAPGFAKLGDIVVVQKCRAENGGRCDVRHEQTGNEAYFALTCGAERLEKIEVTPTPTETNSNE